MEWEGIIGIMPVSWLVLAALGILVLGGRGGKQGSNPLPPCLALAGLALSFGNFCYLWTAEPGALFAGALRLDRLGLFVGFLTAIVASVTVLLSIDYLKKNNSNHDEFYSLTLFSAAGMMIMGMSSNFLSLLLGIEIMSLSLYVLCGFFRDESRRIEASIKYFLTGSFATGLLIFGIGLIYGGCGSLDFEMMGAALRDSDPSGLIFLGTGFLVAGFAFKVAAAPFHMWLPDVYEGSPTTITGFMAAGVKVATFAAFLRVFAQVYQHDSTALRETLWWVAVLTMSIGNFAALAQKSVKRMLAYSSVSHAGYILVGVVAMTGETDPVTGVVGFGQSLAGRAVLFYLLAYAVTNLGTFGILAYLERRGGDGLDFEDLSGLRARFPLLSFALSVFMLSLAGIPGTAGFIGKFLVLGSALDAAFAGPAVNESLVLLVILAILNSLVGLYYYLRVPVQLYVKPLPEELVGAAKPAYAGMLKPVVVLTLAATLWLGFGPDVMHLGVEPALDFVASALESLK